MDDKAATAELDHLKARNKKLAEDRAYFQLILRLIEKLDPLPGLEDMLRNMLFNIVECVGGTNIKLYYWIGKELRYVDFVGESKCLAAIDDPDVAQVAETHEFIDQRGGAEEALLMHGMLRGSYTWTFPLLIGQDLVGVIKLENLHIHGESLGKYLPIFFSHAALILGNEIRNTLHRQSEEDLHIATERLQLATEAGLIGIWDWDVVRDELVWDESMYRLYGRREGDFGGAYDAWIAAVHPDDKVYVDGEIQAGLRGEHEYAPEFRVIWPDGSVHYLKAASKTTYDAAGRPQRMVGINYDLTERRWAEEAQRRLNRELRAISNCNQALMRAEEEQTLLGDICRIVCDEAGYRMAWVGYAENDEAKTVRPVAWAGVEDGYLAQAEITWAETERGRGPSGTAIRSGKSACFRDFTTDPLAAPWRESAVLRGYRSTIALPLKDESANTFGILTIYATEPNAFTVDEIRLLEELAGDLAFGIMVLRARSVRKQAEEELRRYKDHLEEEVRQRTAELVQARNAAEGADLAKSVFLSNMSHELRTPLNAILGFSALIRKNPALPESLWSNLDIINRSGEHLLALINDVLEIAKIEAGRIQLSTAPFDLGSMVRDVKDMMQVRAEQKGLLLQIDQDSRFPRYVVGDEARLRQVLINLLGNAIKFTGRGSVTLRLGTRQNTITHLLIEIEDTGVGIPAADQQHIFEPFVQLGDQGASKGTGLGLTITRQFVQMMGGRIDLESEVGKGSLFRVDLPLSEAHETDIAAAQDQGQGEVAGLAPGQPRYRILIVEDQLDNQMLLLRLMETLQLDVRVAADGKEGVRIFQHWHPNLIWMDRRMPGMDGLEATRRIRQLRGGKEVKIVAVTAAAFREQQDEMRAGGADDVISKPYRIEEIYVCLARQLGLKYVYRSESVAAQGAPATPIRVLIVDDDHVSRFLTKELMRESSFMLREAASGPEALDTFWKWQPQLILMDMRMPGMDGMETTRRLRALPGGDEVLIVALTAGALDEQRAEFIAAGCNEVAIKPVDLDKVRQLLARYLGSHATDTTPVRQLRSNDLPAPLRQQLLDAAIRLDSEAVAAVCASLDARQPEVAAAIRTLTDNFRYDELVRRLEESMPD